MLSHVACRPFPFNPPCFFFFFWHFFFFLCSQLTNLRALTIDGNFLYGRVPDLSGLSNLQVCVLSVPNDTNAFCCPSEAEMPPMGPCRCQSAQSCNGAPATLTYTQLLRLWAASTRLQVLAMRRNALQALIALLTAGDKGSDDEDDGEETPVDKRVTAAASNSTTTQGNGNGKGKEKQSTRKVNAKLVDSKGRVVAFELEDGSVAQVRRTEVAVDGTITGYELEDGSFIAAADATDATSKSSGLSKQTIIIIGAVSGAVALVLCIAGAYVLFHWQQRAHDDDDDDDDLTAAAANASPIEDGFGVYNGTDDMQATDAELRPVKRARKHQAPRQNARAMDALDLPGTLASPIGVPRQHGSDEGLLAPKHSSGDSLPSAATRANLAGYVAPPSSGSMGTTGWNHGSDEALKAPKHSSGDAMPGAQTRADLMQYVPGAEVDEQSVLDATPQLYFSPGKDSSPLESPFSDNYEDRPASSSDHGLYEGSSSSSSGEQRANGFQLYLHDNGHDDDSHAGAASTPALESASASEQAKTRGTKRRAVHNSKVAEQHFSNIKLPNELKPARKKKPVHLRKHKNPVEEFDNIVLPAEMRGRKTVVIDEEESQ